MKQDGRALTLVLDQPDWKDVHDCMGYRETWPVPRGASNHEGALLAEICRGWKEFLSASQRPFNEYPRLVKDDDDV